MKVLKHVGAAFFATSMLCTINVANAKIFVGTSQVAERVNLIDKDLIESQNNELLAFIKDREARGREREREIEKEIEKKRKREIEKEILEREREIKQMEIRKREMQREMEIRKREMQREMEIRKRSLGSITEKSLPYSVDCPPENKKLKIKLNKKTGEIVVRFAKGKKFYQGNFDKALKVFENTYGDKCVE